MPRVIIANRLSDGRVVFLGPARAWVDEIAGALCADSEDETAELQAIAEECEARCAVVDPYPIEIEVQGRACVPRRRREAIRAQGPSVEAVTGEAREGRPDVRGRAPSPGNVRHDGAGRPTRAGTHPSEGPASSRPRRPGLVTHPD